MADYNSKYTGEQVEEYLDKIANDELINEMARLIPTNVSELKNDKGYLTEIPDGYATKEDVGEAIADKVASSAVSTVTVLSQAEYDTLETKDETTLYLITE